jgi:hypothetical protein
VAEHVGEPALDAPADADTRTNVDGVEERHSNILADPVNRSPRVVSLRV